MSDTARSVTRLKGLGLTVKSYLQSDTSVLGAWVHAGSILYTVSHTFEDMMVIGVPCPLFSNLNGNVRGKEEWNPFIQCLAQCLTALFERGGRPGSFAKHC